MANRKGYNKEWYENRKSKGLCITCKDGVAIENKTTCHICTEKNRLKRVNQIKNNKERGICVDCANLVVHGRTQCQSCLDKDKIKTKIRLQVRKDTGICVRCSNKALAGLVHCAECLLKLRLSNRNTKQKVLDHYGQKCNCKCGCNVTRFNHLTIDHVNNDGHIHRAKVGFSIYRWIVKNNFPDDLQVLCWNCNCAKQQYGGCSDEDMTATRPNRLKNKRKETPMPEVTPTHPNFV